MLPRGADRPYRRRMRQTTAPSSRIRIKASQRTLAFRISHRVHEPWQPPVKDVDKDVDKNDRARRNGGKRK